MSFGMPIETCEHCSRPAIVCRRGIGVAGDGTERVICDALHHVVALNRFESGRPGFARPFLSEDAQTVGSRGRTHVALSVGTVALMREWRRSLKDERYRPAVRVRVCEAIATEIVQALFLDLVDVDLDATIGDLCPRCRQEKTGAEGARDYWCQSCMDAVRKEVERE